MLNKNMPDLLIDYNKDIRKRTIEIIKEKKLKEYESDLIERLETEYNPVVLKIIIETLCDFQSNGLGYLMVKLLKKASQTHFIDEKGEWTSLMTTIIDTLKKLKIKLDYEQIKHLTDDQYIRNKLSGILPDILSQAISTIDIPEDDIKDKNTIIKLLCSWMKTDDESKIDKLLGYLSHSDPDISKVSAQILANCNMTSKEQVLRESLDKFTGHQLANLIYLLSELKINVKDKITELLKSYVYFRFKFEMSSVISMDNKIEWNKYKNLLIPEILHYCAKHKVEELLPEIIVLYKNDLFFSMVTDFVIFNSELRYMGLIVRTFEQMIENQERLYYKTAMNFLASIFPASDKTGGAEAIIDLLGSDKARDRIIELFQDQELKSKAILLAGKLNVQKAIPELKSLYNQKNKDALIALLKLNALEERKLAEIMLDTNNYNDILLHRLAFNSLSDRGYIIDNKIDIFQLLLLHDDDADNDRETGVRKRALNFLERNTDLYIAKKLYLLKKNIKTKRRVYKNISKKWPPAAFESQKRLLGLPDDMLELYISKIDELRSKGYEKKQRRLLSNEEDASEKEMRRLWMRYKTEENNLQGFIHNLIENAETFYIEKQEDNIYMLKFVDYEWENLEQSLLPLAILLFDKDLSDETMNQKMVDTIKFIYSKLDFHSISGQKPLIMIIHNGSISLCNNREVLKLHPLSLVLPADVTLNEISEIMEDDWLFSQTEKSKFDQLISKKITLAMGKIEDPYFFAAPIDTGSKKELFIGREHDIKRILDALEKSTVILTGPRKIGKTSVLFNLDGIDRWEDRFIFIKINFESFSPDELASDGNFFAAFFRRLAEEYNHFSAAKELLIGKDKIKGEEIDNLFNKLIANILPGKILVISIDETEIVINNCPSVLNILKIKATTYNSKLRFIFTGAHRLNKELSNRDFSLYRFGEPIVIGELSNQKSEELIRIAERYYVRYDDECIKEIKTYTGNEPYLIQRFCSKIIDILNENRSTLVTSYIIDKSYSGLKIDFGEIDASVEKLSKEKDDKEESNTLLAVFYTLPILYNSDDFKYPFYKVTDIHKYLKNLTTKHNVFSTKAINKAIEDLSISFIIKHKEGNVSFSNLCLAKYLASRPYEDYLRELLQEL
ncbi:hypothetical protein MBAV_002851 [Candidatus Magnetobacterium bavaricum]|uniref:Uncharacterized protein n=1 Tax=Candidatus Magnetobacterium bavaricum TaxID=29290 RepID=A0A0F3GSP8_9BACT|nr:hypothetical protein MBAV_002851 [Candidatus Magnetobacterium bavaricum]